ncbi:hypothetical protein IFM89_009869 [Coptis chinensis]|uniref:Protein kinase domain-containing protein n=1 Tax=Coptis chinensis TaxID=261450 RepID=A0A835I3L6_9MAGN|nr:hypothetical protein IFM89_009869 [Coptis chinensis]
MVVTCSVSSPRPGKWVKGNAIGAGSFGVVSMAMNTCTGELFAMKSSFGTTFRALENEANILEKLSSPYIIQCLGREVSNEAHGEQKLNVFMEYMAGGTLLDIAEKFGYDLNESVIRVYARDILKGLDYLHENGIVHCDLKCKNVLLGSTGNIKLADFGSAKRLGSSKAEGEAKTSSQPISGTPLWMAPEVLRKEGLDFASDIWSLGCTIIEMVTGRPPWGHETLNPMASILKIASSNEVPPFPTKLSKVGLDFLDKCLQRDPKMRYTTQELLAHPFITGKKSNSEVAACSPASVLDVGLDYDSDGPDSRKKATPSKIPFSKRLRCERKRSTSRTRQRIECDLVSSGNWITVRSS